jgi:hypothetical protein
MSKIGNAEKSFANAFMHIIINLHYISRLILVNIPKVKMHEIVLGQKVN